MLSRDERLELFFIRLAESPAAATPEEAYQLLCDTLNEVEEEHSGVPFNPDTWRSDGRLYPPQLDSIRSVPDIPSAKCYRSKGHDSIIGPNGAIEIRTRAGEVLFTKAGADGKKVTE